MPLKNVILYAVIIASAVASWFIWQNSPEYVRSGGPLIVVGLTCFFMVLTFSAERFFVLARAGGRGSARAFVLKIRMALEGGDLGEAIQACKAQGGSLANVIGAGLERFRDKKNDPAVSEPLQPTRHAIVEAASLETPHLERNLTALSTLASIATLIGLLGTTIGMIRAFRAMSQAGAPDATQLALGISEALVNTAIGLFTAIIGTVFYNYFSTRVDGVVNGIEETSYEVLRLLESEKDT